MKIWTIQSPEVVKYIRDHDVYYPDFSKSTTLGQIPAYSSLYNSVLKSYNRMNCLKAKGLIFGFRQFELKENGSKTLNTISTIEEFTTLLVEQIDDVKDLLEYLELKNGIILELEYNTTYLNLLNVDFTAFKMLEADTISGVLNNKDYILMSRFNLMNGVMGYPLSIKDPSLVQMHMHYISIKNVINIYPLPNLDKNYLG